MKNHKKAPAAQRSATQDAAFAYANAVLPEGKIGGRDNCFYLIGNEQFPIK